MRRRDQEVTDINRIRDILQRGQMCHIALNDGETPYVFPLNYGYQLEDDGALTLYFHSAHMGKKLDLLRENGNASFAVSLSGDLITGDRACDWSMFFGSVLGTGVLTEVKDDDERAAGLTLLMKHHGRTEDFTYEPRVMMRTVILKLTVSSYTGKSNFPKE